MKKNNVVKNDKRMIDREYFFKKLEISNLHNFYHCFITQYSKNINKIFKRNVDELFLAINDNLFNLNIIYNAFHL